MVLLRENEYAKKMITDLSLGQKPVETLRYVARYYLDNGYSSVDVRNKLDIFLAQCDPMCSIIKWSNILDSVLKYAEKREAVNIDSIKITDKEMAKIRMLGGKQLRRIAFTLLCLSKYQDIVSGSYEHWVNTPDSEIMKLANVSTSLDRQNRMFHQLKDLGYIEFSKKIENLSNKVLFGEGGKVVLEVSDFRNLGFQYLKYCGEPFIKCKKCGLTVKRGAKNQRLCQGCAKENAIQSTVNSVMKARNTL